MPGFIGTTFDGPPQHGREDVDDGAGGDPKYFDFSQRVHLEDSDDPTTAADQEIPKRRTRSQ